MECFTLTKLMHIGNIGSATSMQVTAVIGCEDVQVRLHLMGSFHDGPLAAMSNSSDNEPAISENVWPSARLAGKGFKLTNQTPCCKHHTTTRTIPQFRNC